MQCLFFDYILYADPNTGITDNVNTGNFHFTRSCFWQLYYVYCYIHFVTAVTLECFLFQALIRVL